MLAIKKYEEDKDNVQARQTAEMLVAPTASAGALEVQVVGRAGRRGEWVLLGGENDVGRAGGGMEEIA